MSRTHAVERRRASTRPSFHQPAAGALPRQRLAAHSKIAGVCRVLQPLQQLHRSPVHRRRVVFAGDKCGWRNAAARHGSARTQ